MTDQQRRDFMKQAAGAMAVVAIGPGISAAATRAPARANAAAKVQVAVVGVGRQGRAMLLELPKIDGVQVAALCDIDPDRLASGLRRAGAGAEGFADYKQMLDKKKEITAVIVATPTHQHVEIVKAALSAGKHVYCEAPIAHTIEDAKAIADAAKAAGSLVFQAGLLARSNPIYQLAKTFLHTDAVRDLVSLRAQFAQKTQWRSPLTGNDQEKVVNWHLDPEVSLGLAGEMGVHQFDVYHMFMETFPKTVSGFGDIRVYKDGRAMPDTIACEAVWPEGVRLQYQATICSSFEGKHEVFHGSNASIKLAWTAGWMFKEADAATQGWEVYANRQQFFNDEGITLIADATKLASQGKLKEGVGLPNSPLYYGLSDFVTSVAEKKPPATTALDGYRSTVVAISAAKAVAKGEVVSIDPALMKGA